MKKICVCMLVLVVSCTTVWANGTGEASSDVVKIELFQQKREIVDVMDDIIKEFETENPGIVVTQVNMDNSSQVLQNRLAIDKVPDVLTHWPNRAEYLQAADDGFFVKLDNDDSLLDPVVPGVLDSIRLADGSNCAIPLAFNVQGIFYNTELFSRYGYAIPKTWGDLIALCKDMQAKGLQPFVFADGTAWTLAQQFRMSLALDADGDAIIDALQSGKAQAQDREDLREIALKFLELRAYGQANSLGTSYEQACMDFSNEKALMFWQGDWAIPNIRKANPDLAFSMFPLPSYTGRPTRVEYGVDMALVMGNTGDAKRMEAARKLVGFIASKRIGQEYSDKVGAPTCIVGVEFKNETSRSLVDMVQDGRSFRNIRYRYPAGGDDRAASATQQLIANEDVEQWLEEMNFVLGYTGSK